MLLLVHLEQLRDEIVGSGVMMESLTQLMQRMFTVFRATIDAWRDDRADRLAAALSFYAIFSLVPSLVIVIGLAGLIVDQRRVEGELVLQVQRLAGIDAGEFVAQVLENRNQDVDERNLFATLLGLGTVLFGASGAYSQLQSALNTIWKVRAKPKRGLINFLRRRLFAFVILLLIGFMLIFSLVINTWLVLIDGWLWVRMPEFYLFFTVGNVIASFGVTMLLFALLYKVMPDVTIRWHDIWVGAGVTALLFNLGKWGMGLYLGNSTLFRTFGAAGALVALLVWVYYSALILLFGAEFIRAFAMQRGRAVLPASHAVHVRWIDKDTPHKDTPPID